MSIASFAASQQPCKTVQPLEDLDIQSWASAKWYSHQQRESPAQSVDFFYCVTAEYSFLDPTVSPEQAAGLANGYTVKVLNVGQNAEGVVSTSDDPSQELGDVPSGLCAGQGVFTETFGDLDSQLTVGFCVIPAVTFLAPNYWVLAYDEDDGYGLVAGGQTDIPNNDGSGLCTYSDPFNGLWIFSRSPVRNEAMIEKYRGIAMDNGIDPNMMKDVSLENCGYMAPPTASPPATKSPKENKKGKKGKKTPKGSKKGTKKAKTIKG